MNIYSEDISADHRRSSESRHTVKFWMRRGDSVGPDMMPWMGQ